MSLRPTSLTVHLWVGLFAAVFLFLEGTTGGIIAWGPEVFRLANPPGPRISPPDLRVAPGPAELPLTGLVGGLEKSHPGFRVVRMAFGAA